MCSSPASHPDTGVSESHQGVSIPSGRSAQQYLERSHHPVKKGTDESLNIIPLRTHNPCLHKSIPDILHQSSQPEGRCQALVQQRPLSPHSPLTTCVQPSAVTRWKGWWCTQMRSELWAWPAISPPATSPSFHICHPKTRREFHIPTAFFNFFTASFALSTTTLVSPLNLCKKPSPKNLPTRHHFSSVQSFSRVQLFTTSWTTAHQALLSITNSQSGLKLMSFELVMPSNHLILCHPLLLPLQSFPASGSFPVSHFFASGGQSIGFSVSVPSMNSQD